MADPMSPAAPIKACKNCARAKSKCSGYIFNTKCERCLRLKKDCGPQPTIIRRYRPLKTTTRIAQLESKLDGLVSILSTETGQHPHCVGDDLRVASDTTSEVPSNTSPPSKTSEPLVDLEQDQASTLLPQPKKFEIFHWPTLPDLENPVDRVIKMLSVCSSIVSKEHEDPETLLNRFRDPLTSQVPWIVIPPDLTASNLLQEKPFLYFNIIMAASSGNILYQRHLGQESIRYIGERLIQRGEKNLDTLQGMTVLLSWYQDHIYQHSQMNNLLQLLLSLLTDLGLYRAPQRSQKHDAFLDQIRPPRKTVEKHGPISLEEKRIVLGCYYLWSCFTFSFSKMEPPKYTANTNECCNVVANAAEQPSDRILVYLVRLQRIAERIRQNNLHEEPAPLKAPVGIYVKLSRAELAAFKNSLPDDLRHNTSILMHYSIAEIQLYDICFSLPFDPNLPLQRTELLYASQASAAAFLDAFYSIPLERYFMLTLINLGQVFQVLTSISKLCLFEGEDLDLAQMRALVDLSGVIERLCQRMEHATALYDSGGDTSTWALCGKKLRQMNSWYEARLLEDSISAGPPLPGALETLATGDGALQFDFDDDFWQGIHNSCDFV
ncbi:MAG: hypothetical protein M1818_005055 [Claussenomyces sp. TS43310]|nr:MAG: hypothetical protein M1818_005055 [Claussenomyces sp. TS43310]